MFAKLGFVNSQPGAPFFLFEHLSKNALRPMWLNIRVDSCYLFRYLLSFLFDWRSVGSCDVCSVRSSGPKLPLAPEFWPLHGLLPCLLWDHVAAPNDLAAPAAKRFFFRAEQLSRPCPINASLLKKAVETVSWDVSIFNSINGIWLENLSLSTFGCIFTRGKFTKMLY